MEPQEDRVRRVAREQVALVPYDPSWPESFRLEKERLLSCLPSDLVRRIEHFGSTAVPGLSAKPIVDMLVEVADLSETRARIVPVLEARGYEYFWRPTFGDDVPPFYAWFIKRDGAGRRTHHIHMVEASFTEHWDRLLFRDHLIAHPDVARRYQELKIELASRHAGDRLAYARAKAAFIDEITAAARKELDESRER
ncbi:MAG: GrpB family protein [Vicinamibacteria bacterium]|nr:GrpB family protein [Vicinamibacteria bacterium]